MNGRGFFVFGIGSGIAYVRISKGDDLLGIGRISEDFLVPVIEVLKTTSPTDDPSAPMETPRNTVPSSRTNSADLLKTTSRIKMQK